MGVDHPLVDGRAGHYVWTESLADRVCYSELLGGFLGWAAREGLRPVVVTHPNGRMTFPLWYQLMSAGGLWLRKENRQFRDLRSGAVYSRIEDVPDTPEDSGLPVPGVDDSHVWWSFSVSVQHRADTSTTLGGVAEIVWRELTGTAPAAWGWWEPCLMAWDRDGYTESAKTLMPYGRMVISGADHWAGQAIGVVRRNSFGVEEAVTGMAVATGTDVAALGQKAVQALEAVGAMMPMPTVGLVSVLRGGPEVLLGLPVIGSVTPLAVVAGPRATRALGVDAHSFASKNGGLVRGPGRFPSVVLPLAGSTEDVWRRIGDVVSQFSTDQWVAAMNPPATKGAGHAS